MPLPLLLFLLVGSSLWPVWQNPAWFLILDDHPSQLDALVLMGGESAQRSIRLVEAFQTYHPRIVLLSGLTDTDPIHRLLIAAGAKPEQIIDEKKAISTLENARFALPLLRQAQVHRVGLVTSWYHTRRSKRVFQTAGPDLTFFAIGTTADRPPDLLHLDAEADHAVGIEFRKTIGYWLLYGICPFDCRVLR